MIEFHLLTDKICAKSMKNTPTRTFEACGAAADSGLGISADRVPSEDGDVIVLKIIVAVSFTASLTMDPLSPTIATPGVK